MYINKKWKKYSPFPPIENLDVSIMPLISQFRYMNEQTIIHYILSEAQGIWAIILMCNIFHILSVTHNIIFIFQNVKAFWLQLLGQAFLNLRQWHETKFLWISYIPSIKEK